MSLVQITLIIVTISTGLFTGLLLTMLFIFEPLLNSLSATEYTELMQQFLKVARRSPLNLTLMVTSIIAPIPALIGLYQYSSWVAFGLALVGVIVFFIGMFLVSRLLNEPLYDQISNWTVQTPPTDWQVARQRWHVLNLVRAFASGTAFVLFLVTFSAIAIS